VLTNLGITYYKKGDSKTALELWNRVLDIDPRNEKVTQIISQIKNNK